MNTDQILIVVAISAYIVSTLAFLNYLLSGVEISKRIGIPFAALGCAVQFSELVYRWQTSHIWPLTNLYGSLSLFAAMSVLIFILFAVEYLASGHLFPLDLLPPLLGHALFFTPFPSMLYTPIAIYLGKFAGAELARALLMQLFWVVATYGLARFTWRRA